MAESTFTFRVEDELKDAFNQIARANDRTGAQLLRDFMRDYISRQQEAADYDRWFREQVEAARRSIKAGQGIPHEEVEAEFAELRAQSLRKAGLQA